MKQEKPTTARDDSYANEYMSIYGSNEPEKDTSNTHTTHETFDAIDTLNNPNVNIHDSNITPDILLEQLAYVDNFIPSLDQDFVNLDSWVMNESQNDHNNNSNNNNGSATSINNNNNNNVHGGSIMNTVSGNTFGLDEQLAVELSAFADEVFIFPDEDKPQNNNNNNNEDEEDEENIFNNKSDTNDDHKNRNHILSQRRNKFLTSQYDHSKSRFSSRRSHHENDANDNNNDVEDHDNNNIHPSFDMSNNLVHDDHSGFTNFEVDGPTNNMNNARDEDDEDEEEEEGQENNINNHSQVSLLPQHRAENTNPPYQRNHVPSISSPLSNLVANNLPLKKQKKQTINSNNVTHDSQEPQIHMPDYSQIPTSTLVALLPRVKVPEGAHTSLLKAGFAEDQIVAISAIIAYNEQHKQQIKYSSESHSNGSSNDERSSSDKGAHFLLDLLSDKKPTKRSRSQPQVNRETPHSQPSPVNTNINNNGRRQESNVSEPAAVMHATPDVSNIRQNVQQQKQQQNRHNSSDDNTLTSPNYMRHASEPISKKQNIVSKPVNKLPSGNAKIPSDLPVNSASTIKKESCSSITNISSAVDHSVNSNTQPKVEPTSHSTYAQKKKLKGKELENSINELNDLALKLQQKIHTLEMENKLLKDLVVNSGEQEGIEQAESIKQNLLKRAHQTTQEQENIGNRHLDNDGSESDDEDPKKKRKLSK
ncbi:similar to Saccharomyces cerevisiae YNL103W MET4 Leucine-zipper transcriptional activator [Maudiozyma barnettii]|uniref:Similar to Saccharomyces cerevisiae YNL103W MET4 Leucine-zipper transcriptional activator n=1 Tax=Maudiozyma barnettii TaxID=61262 RepID=A0A8H2ZFM4_9SACH|nr:Met4p [Kazachstania barnettii]CAB4252505.1 similar to Saccharomyces cerevisiae YNL103W MET4 Leucine-zipper transcriptional activator [Kazachstania barnettii]CAD1779239.1 similar to Saccharomyces cerevisiae YNL103W MET4 Leucine-zipper transcriptional activator [Kazachstania barnettii]